MPDNSNLSGPPLTAAKSIRPPLKTECLCTLSQNGSQ